MTHRDLSQCTCLGTAGVVSLAALLVTWTGLCVQAKIRVIEAHLVLGDREQAETWLLKASRADSSFRSTPVYKGLAERIRV